MADYIPAHYKRAFQNNWDHEIQQLVAKLRDRVYVDNFGGKEKVYTTLGQVSFTERLGRLTKSNPQEIQASKRKMTKRDFKVQHIFDRMDAEYLGKELSTPDSELMMEYRNAWNRSVDDLIIEAASATVYGGETEPYTTTIDIAAAQQVAVNFGGSSIGMTAVKLKEARRKFMVQEVYPDEEDITLYIGPKQESDLYAIVAAATNDVDAEMIAAWLKDRSKKLFGFNVKISNRLEHVSSTDVRTCLAIVKNGIFAAPDKMSIEVDVLPNQDHAIQLSGYGLFGCMRRYEQRVMEIYCDESP